MSNLYRKSLAFVLVSLASSGTTFGQIPGASFQGLGGLSGYRNARVSRVSADGITAVGTVADNSSGFPCRWTELHGLEILQVNGSNQLVHGWASAASGNGSVIVGWNEQTGVPSSFHWTSEPGMQPLPSVSGGGREGWASDVSTDGTVVFGTVNSDILGKRVYRYDFYGGLTYIPVPEGVAEIEARGASESGTILTGDALNDSGLIQAFYWTAATGTVLFGDVPGWEGFSTAYAVAEMSGPGDMIIVGASPDANYIPRATKWMLAGGLVSIDPATGDSTWSSATAISHDGSTIVGDSSPLGAFLWTEEDGMRSIKSILENDYGLDLGDFHLLRALDISANGRVIVGRGVNPDGESESWIASFPECSSDDDCDDGIDCTDDSCGPDYECNYQANPRNCDDGIFCNGPEICDATLGCLTDQPFSCSDNKSCTVDVCNEDLDRCDHTPDDSRCDDGLYCNGQEYCSVVSDCVSYPVPCSGLACDEDDDSCFACQTDIDCDDGLYCNGIETCDSGACEDGASPCGDGESCDETTDDCFTDAIPSVTGWGLMIMVLLIMVEAKRRTALTA